MSKKWLAFIISGLTINMIMTAAFTAYFFIATKNVEFDKDKLVRDDVSVEYFAESGEQILLKNDKLNEKYVKISDLSENTKNAFVAIEDKRFYKHGGLDYLRMIKAAMINLKTFSFKEGASTISQQLVKNTHLSNEKTITRKLKEIKLTKQMEKVMTKDEILESYLNTVYFGKGAYGIEAASKIYFNKTADKLTLNEAAALAATIKSPSAYSPAINNANCFKRKNLVISAMLKRNFISTEEYDANVKNPVSVINADTRDNYSDYVSAALGEYENIAAVPTYLKKAKVKIYTYLDKNIQNHIATLKVDGDSQDSRNQIVINNKNASVIAFYGKNSNLQRCPASAIKPLYVYAPLIDNGKITESTVLLDEQTSFGGYSPKNYGDKYSGKVTVKTAVSKSLNVPAVRLLSYYGTSDGVALLQKTGVTADGNNLSSALGSGIEVSLKKLCDLYSAFPSDGEYKESRFIKKIEVNGVSVYERKTESVKLLKDSTAYIINDALKECAKTGTAKKLRDLKYEVCAKTGTNGNQNGNLDAYCVAYTSEHIVGVWYGNEDASLMPSKISGGTYPAVRVKSVLNKLYETAPPQNFSTPESVIGVKIDENTLLKEEKTYLTTDKSGKLYYYAVGTEPTERAPDKTQPTIINYNLSVGANSVDIALEVKDAQKIVIYKIINGTKTEAYNGNAEGAKISGNLNGYKLEIVPFSADGTQGESVVTPIIKYVPSEWWDD